MGWSVDRERAAQSCREVLADAEARHASARETRRMLRARRVALNINRWTWYAAAVRAAGCLLLALDDPRQQRLPLILEPAPRQRTRLPRKKTPHAPA